jgi:TnpA family transposase
MPEMQILNALEQSEFDSPPEFDSANRKKHFDFPLGILELVEQLRTPTNKACFLLASGYFSATKKFYAPQQFRQLDIEYVCGKVGLNPQDVNFAQYDKQTLLRHEQMILIFYGFKPFNARAVLFVDREIENLVALELKPRLVFYRVVDLLVGGKIAVPNYHRLSDLILRSLRVHKLKLVQTIELHLSSETRSLLDSLFEKAIDPQRASNRYRLTLLKKCSQSTKPGRIKETVEDFQVIKTLHLQVQNVLQTLALSPGAIHYYANSVIRSDTFNLARRTEEDRYLHLIAFIAHQFFRLQDTLIDTFLLSMQSAVHTAQRDHKEKCYEQRELRSGSLKSVVSYLDASLNFREAIGQITNDPELNDAEKVGRIRGLLSESMHQQETVVTLKKECEFRQGGGDYYDILEERSVKMQNRATPILKALTFNSELTTVSLVQAIDHFKERDGALDSNAPMDFLSAEERAAACSNGRFSISLYKAFLFIHVLGGIKSGTLNLEHSYKYRPLDTYLIAKSRWESEKAALLERAELTELSDPKKVLEVLDQKLFEQYQKTNENLLSGANSFVSFTNQGSLRVNTPKLEEKEVEPLQGLFPEKQYVSLSEVLATVDRHSAFLDEFQHWQQRHNRSKPAKKTFIAAISAIGCDIGMGKILKISREINPSELENTVNWFFYPEGLQAVNDQLLHFMDGLELPNIYRKSQNSLHTSSDGQKFEVRLESLNANYSFKYFGRGKGVSVYSFIDERHLLFHSTVISSAERESAYVIDGLMHNEVIKSDIHSTDTHGYSEAIFGAMHLLGFSYAPRIKNFKRQSLYLFKTRKDSDRSQWKVNPSGYINTELIENNWDDILRLIATIKLKETTASDLFRRLNSYSKQHPLYAALKAFGRIPKSIFILQYIDDVELRQVIEKQLNKIESSHRFSREISIGNGRELAQAEKQEQEIAEACKRLIKNAIVCWNYLYLTQKVVEEKDPEAKKAALQSIAAGSVVSWGHVNLLGEYDFSDEKLQDSVGIKPPKTPNLSVLR